MQCIECMLLSDYYMSGFRETVPRKTAKNTVKHRGGSVSSVVANRHGGGGNSVTVTTLLIFISDTACNSELYSPLIVIIG